MNETQAMHILIEANPVPDAGTYATDVLADRRPSAAVFLTATQERTMTQTLDPQPTKTPTPKRPWWQPALAAAAIVLVVIATAALVLSSGSDEVVTPPEEPVPTTAVTTTVVEQSAGLFSTGTDAAQAWTDNANNPDWDTYVSYFSTSERDDIQTVTATDSLHGTFAVGRSVEDAQEGYELMSIVGAEYALVGDCEEVGPGGYHCPVVVTGGLVDALTGGELEFVLQIALGVDGYIQSVSGTLGDGAAAQVAFLEWLAVNDAPLHDEWRQQVIGVTPLERPLADIVADYRQAQQDYLGQS